MSDAVARPERSGAASENVSAVGLLNKALRHGRLLVLVPLLSAVLAVGLSLLFGSTYAAESTFKPESRQVDMGGLGGLASQIGFDLGSLSEGESVEYYAQLLESREILTDALQSEYAVEGLDGPRRADLLTLYEIQGETPHRRLWNGVQKLRGDIGVSYDHASGLVFLETEAPSPALAEQLNARLLELLNRFNLEKRQSQARAEREFVEAQVAEAASELEAAEARLARFLEQNRRYQGSPELANEAERLRRRVDHREQVHTLLAQSYEQAKLDEVRNTPVFTVLDRPEGSARQVGGVLKSAILGFLLGLVVAGFWVFMREYLAAQRVRHPDDFAELDRRLDRLLPWRRKRATGGSRRPAGDRTEAPVEGAPSHPVHSG